MKLSKDQIQYIDDYLKHHKFKYWDIRYEILDHIVNMVEDKMEQGTSFDDAMIEVHQSFGNSMKMLWNTGVEYSIFANGDGYKKLYHVKVREITKKYRKQMFTEFKNFFKSFKNLLFILLVIVTETQLYTLFNYTILFRINIISILLIIIVISLFVVVKYHLKKNFSFALDSVSSTMVLPLLFLSAIQQIFKTELSGFVYFSLVTGYLVISVIWFFSGVKVYLRTFKKYNTFYHDLKAA